MDDDDAWAVVSNFFERFNDDTDVLSVWYASNEDWVHWKIALSVLSTPPANAMLAQALVEKAFTSLQTHLESFQTSLVDPHATLSSISTALQHLYFAFQCVQLRLQECCERLAVLDVSCELAAAVWCFLLQPDLLTGEEPLGKPEFMEFLTRHAETFLSKDLAKSNIKEETRENEDEECVSNNVHLFGRLAKLSSAPPRDMVFECLHGLMLSSSREIKTLWRSILDACVQDRINSLQDVYNKHFIKQCIAWEEEVVEPFIDMALPPVCDSHETHKFASSSYHKELMQSSLSVEFTNKTLSVEKKRWCEDFRKKNFILYARNRIRNFWDIMVEYPDSIPTLQDIRYCLHTSRDENLKDELLQYVRNLLASRLHRAGISTEDILEVLSKTISSLCVLLTRSEQGALLFTVVSDTLEHLRRRKDCIPEIIKLITQPNGNASGAIDDAQSNLQREEEDAGLNLRDINDDDEYYGDGADYRQDDTLKAFDTLRVLLATISVKSLSHEYEKALAQGLLERTIHTFDTTSEEEMLERLKCVLGQDVLLNCAVMLWDVQMSKRTTHQIQEKRLNKTSPPLGLSTNTVTDENFSRQTTLLPDAVSVDVLSLTAWPSLSHCFSFGVSVAVPDQYVVHPVLQKELDYLAANFKSVKLDQRLNWILSQGRVVLEVDLLDPLQGHALKTVSHILPLFAASVVLHLRDLEAKVTVSTRDGTRNSSDKGTSVPISIDKLASRVGVSTVEKLMPCLVNLSPSVVTIYPGSTHVAIQKFVSNASNIVFKNDDSDHKGEEESSGLSPLQIKAITRMIISKLKTSAAQSLSDIHNSVKKFVDFTVRVTDIKTIMQTLLSEGSVACTDGKHYTLSSK
ncbi:unnamed protein product [Phytomonas sp. EM1]|nr:unnamed protein product [Phytomonas sp. EM1]|eukprot:CCW61423.1 unnamed protein product [Phytomonas sp. isolate EM1]